MDLTEFKIGSSGEFFKKISVTVVSESDISLIILHTVNFPKSILNLSILNGLIAPIDSCILLIIRNKTALKVNE